MPRPPDACRQVRATRRSPSPWASSRMPLTAPQAAPIGTSRSGSTSRVSSSRAPSPSSKVPRTIPPRVQRRPTRSSAANPPMIRSRPVSTAEMPSSPTNTSGSTTPESRSRSSTSTAPTTAAIAAANPSRNPGRGRMARANRSVMSPPVIQNRARKVIRRPVLRLPTVMARARARATSPRSAVSHQYCAIAGSCVPAPNGACAGGSGGSGCIDIHRRLLAGHGDPQPLLRRDEMVQVFGVVAQVDLDPAHPAGEGAVFGAIVVADRGTAVAADVGGLIRREQHRLGPRNAALADLLTINEQGDGAALGQPAAVVGELHPQLMLARRDRPVADDLEPLQPEQVVAIGRPATGGVQAPATEGAALGDDHPGGAAVRDDQLGGDRIGLVLEV